jgi:biotin transport system substrate-specific component
MSRASSGSLNRPSSGSLATPVAKAFPLRWPLTVALGAAIVALAAQVRIPLPLSPVPLTLQGPAVILVGGLFGAALGLASMVTYLLAGLFGLPVFAGGASGLSHLMGPTGGYLLAFPIAAGLAGRMAERGDLARSLAAAFSALLVIHLGGWAQLTILLGDPVRALTAGTLPFIWLDLAKAAVAALVLWRWHHAFRLRS